jgi:hypothetical protein
VLLRLMLCPTRCVSCSSPRDVLTLAQDDKDVTQLEDKIKRKKNKIKNSEILDALRDEFGQAPEVKTSLYLLRSLPFLSPQESSSSGLGKLSKEQQAIDDEIEERRKFEEDRFVRLV